MSIFLLEKDLQNFLCCFRLLWKLWISVLPSVKISAASLFPCDVALLEGDWLFHSHLFKLWPLGGALVKHSLHLAGLLVISPGTPKNECYLCLVPKGLFYLLWNNCYLGPFSFFSWWVWLKFYQSCLSFQRTGSWIPWSFVLLFLNSYFVYFWSDLYYFLPPLLFLFKFLEIIVLTLEFESHGTIF